MPRSLASVIGVNVAAALDVVAWSEIGLDLLSQSDDGYNVFVGSVSGKPILSNSYADHPMRLVTYKLKSGATVQGSAWGRYQILKRFWSHYKALLKLPDASPVSQDKYAIQQFKEQGALTLFQQGKFEDAIHKIANIWASMPGAGYKHEGTDEQQHENKMDALLKVYQEKGGLLVPN